MIGEFCALSAASLSSASIASCSASGVSGIVSKLEIDGDRDRNEVGVLDELELLLGYKGSLTR
jgi:hypothetical protein